jgi:hypothetical protein
MILVKILGYAPLRWMKIIGFAVAASSETALNWLGWLPLRAANRVALEFIKESH